MARPVGIGRAPKVLMVVGQFPPVYGGAGQQALSLASCLSQRGWDCTVLTMNQCGATHSETYQGVRVERRFGRGLLGGRLGRSAFAAWVTLRVLVTRPVIVHCHGAFWSAVGAALACVLIRRPLVLKLTRTGQDDYKSVVGRRLAGLPIGRVYGLPFHVASKVIALNASDASHAAQVLGTARVITVPNGVDTSRFRPRAQHSVSQRRHLSLPEDALILLFSGYLVAHKGIGDLVAAWRLVPPVIHGRPTLLLLAGPSSGFYAELDAAWLDRVLTGVARIHRLGYVDNALMPTVYQAADAFVLPSKAEGMPNSLLEALASGLPAVATRIPGIEDVLEGSDAALLLPPSSSAPQLAQAIVDILASSPTRSQAARQLAEDSFSSNQIALKYHTIYCDLYSS